MGRMQYDRWQLLKKNLKFVCSELIPDTYCLFLFILSFSSLNRQQQYYFYRHSVSAGNTLYAAEEQKAGRDTVNPMFIRGNMFIRFIIHSSRCLSPSGKFLLCCSG